MSYFSTSAQTIILQEVESTNDYMYHLLGNKDLVEGTIIAAGYQTRGKGHSGNYWHSDPGKNLLMSILLKPTWLEPMFQFYISRILSIAIWKWINNFCKDVSIRWPNDIYIKDKKVAGLLIENIIEGDIIRDSIAGIGVNINQDKFPDNLPNPTSVSLETGCQFDMTKVLDQMKDLIELHYEWLYTKEFEKIDHEYHKILYGKDTFRKFREKERDFTAKIIGTEPTGEIILETREGEILKFGFKEIEYA